MVNNSNDKVSIVNKIAIGIATLLYILGTIGCLWLSFRAIVIEWVYIKESFWNMINPLIHLKVFWYLLHDLDIYAVTLCLVSAYVLMNMVEKEKLRFLNIIYFIIALVLSVIIIPIIPNILNSFDSEIQKNVYQQLSPKITNKDDIL